MKALKFLIGGGVAAAALVTAAPAAAQYYPGYGYGYGSPYGGNVVGQVIGQVLGGGGYGYSPYGGYNYGYNGAGASQVAANQCSAAIQRRMGGYGYAPVTVTSVEVRQGGGYRVRGVTNAGYGSYGGRTGFSCRTDFRGIVTSVNLGTTPYGYSGYNNYGYSNYGYNYSDPYAAYGYRRY
jgi:hypothetical protein